MKNQDMEQDRALSVRDVRQSIITLRGQQVIIDSTVAELYGVQTREINQAVKNNPRKFPEGYIFELEKEEVAELKSKFLISNPHANRARPKAFTEKGLYMLATILKGDRAIETTLSIIESYAKLRELSRTIGDMSANPDEYQQKSLMQKSGEIMADLFGEDLETEGTETEIELNFAVLKLKHTIKRKQKR